VHILLVHNAYGKVSGEEIVVDSIKSLLLEKGHRVSTFFRGSAELEGNTLGQAKAFFTGVYNWSSKFAIRELLRKDRPDIVHIHNLFPLISPSILGECRRAGVPVVMTVHNYRLVCPNGLHMLHGQVCEKCVGGREYNCALNRCEGSRLKSLGYAVRNTVARKMGFFRKNVTMYAALTDFQRKRLIAAGFPPERIAIIPNMVRTAPKLPANPIGEWVGYIGRISYEKGIPTLMAAARSLPDVQFRAAGAYDRMSHLLGEASANFRFDGHLNAIQLREFYQRSRIIVLCSTCFEGFPTVLVEAMLYQKPVICSRIGGLSEIVEDEKTGLLFAPGDAHDLAKKIETIWKSPALCSSMGQAGYDKAMQKYGHEQYYDRLIDIYDRAKAIITNNWEHGVSA
jgi:glycosyltransferase involved in cell wall biosynthesis